jgi:mRNA interferase MazF
MKKIKRGEIYYADLGTVIGSEQKGVRPVLILQNDIGNYFSPTTIIAAITSIPKKNKQPTHISIDKDFLETESMILLEQIRTVDKKRLTDCLGKLDQDTMATVNEAIEISLGLIPIERENACCK